MDSYLAQMLMVWSTMHKLTVKVKEILVPIDNREELWAELILTGMHHGK